LRFHQGKWREALSWRKGQKREGVCKGEGRSCLRKGGRRGIDPEEKGAGKETLKAEFKGVAYRRVARSTVSVGLSEESQEIHERS